MLVRVFLGGALDPKSLALDDGQLVDLAVTEAAALIGATGRPRFVQVDRWAGQLKSYPEKYRGYQARSFEGYDETEEWLRKNVRKTEHLGIIHGDVGTPNMMFRHGPPARLQYTARQ